MKQTKSKNRKFHIWIFQKHNIFNNNDNNNKKFNILIKLNITK